MPDEHRSGRQYSLGHEPDELARLDRQAAAIEHPTRLLLEAAGLARGMRVLDLGTGLGHVALLAGECVAPGGRVLGIDQAADIIAAARRRAEDAGAMHVTFEEGDVGTWRAVEPFDAIVARLLLFHVPDPVAVVRHQVQNLQPGGTFLVIDYDMGSARAEPAVPIVTEAIRWIHEAFQAAGASPRIGARLARIVEEAGLRGVTTFGVQTYLDARAPAGPALIAGIVRSLAPVIVRHGIAAPAQLDLATLERRIAEQVREADAVILPPTVVGAWGYAAA
ncbi:MAG TPA: methyltransferase domain-containing protein [Vicinamibacterales bacterium]|nr:methyltransferase domain-containing protein [Vicinamibacterales bacterium]